MMLISRSWFSLYVLGGQDKKINFNQEINISWTLIIYNYQTWQILSILTFSLVLLAKNSSVGLELFNLPSETISPSSVLSESTSSSSLSSSKDERSLVCTELTVISLSISVSESSKTSLERKKESKLFLYI